MASSPDPNPSPTGPDRDPSAARLKMPDGEVVDPSISLGPDAADAPSSATGELLTRLAHHSLKESRYKLQGEIARGGMGAILKVWDEDLRRTLAMKVVLGKADPTPEGATPPVDSRMLARFLEEAQVTGQLDHPGIAPVHELGLDSDGRVYFTMKLVKGRDLKHIFDLVFEGKEGWNETRALSVMLKVCEAMAYAHTKGVIHRDLKPANVMVGNFGEVYVMDWGLARVLGRKDSHDIRLRPEFTTSLASVKTERREEREDAPDSPLVTMDGDVMGTPAYMPPEQAEGEIERLSPRSDVYAIGSMLYHLLARQMPYVKPRAKISNRTVLAMVLQNAPAPLASLRKDVSAELVAICEKAMAREPEQRYADTLALAEDLRAYLEHRVVGAYETGAWAETKKWVERNTPLAASLAAGILALVGGLIASVVLERKADANFKLAEERRIEAKRNLENLLSLSGVVDVPKQLDELIRRADDLWPASPENVPSYQTWLRDAQALLVGSPADEAKGIQARPGLADQSRKLAEVDARAVPQSEEEREAERRADPRFAELEQKRAKLHWLSCTLGAEPWPSEASVKEGLAKQALPTDAPGLRDLATDLLVSGNLVPEDPVRCLVLARRAVEAASDLERASCRDVLAAALYRTGRFEEALSEGKQSVSEAPADEKQAYVDSLADLDQRVNTWDSSTEKAGYNGERERLLIEVPNLEREVLQRHNWSFPHREDQVLHALLSKVVEDLESISDPKTGLSSQGLSPDHSWSVGKRLEFARTIEERSVSGPEARKVWAEAIGSIRDRAQCPRYDGLEIKPQVGLLPIGRNAESGLWEFADLATGDAAERASDGKVVLKDSSGIVLVLIPGGSFLMGAQHTDPSDNPYDPNAKDDEGPVHEVILHPFFLSKYEMTQAQWERLTAKNPSLYSPSNHQDSWDATGRQNLLLHPVEQVSWDDCIQTLGRLGMTLPTEAQWEYACRAGTRTVYWSGDEMETLRGVANISDAYGKAHGNEHYRNWEDWLDDGQTVHAEVGSYRENPNGLFDMHGNVLEWCLDRYGNYSTPVREGDGERLVQEPIAWSARTRVFRGGSFVGKAVFARSAVRNADLPGRPGSGIGVRPARAVAAR